MTPSKKKSAFLIFALILFLGQSDLLAMEIHAHRGGPSHDLGDSSLEAIRRSISQQVDYIEFDVQMTKDQKFIISHDSTFTEKKCDCVSFSYPQKEKYNIYEMTADEILSFVKKDNGKSFFSEFDDYLKNINAISSRQKLSIELKYGEDNAPSPSRPLLVKKFMELLKKNDLFDRVIVQSFDIGIHEEIRRIESQFSTRIKLVYLYRGDQHLSWDLISKLPFNRWPNWQRILELHKKLQLDYFSPRFSLITSDKLGFRKFLTLNKESSNPLKVVPWTINSEYELYEAKKLNVDGVLTDEIDLAHQLYQKK